MKWTLAFMTIAFLVPTAAFASKGPCTDDRLKFCSGTNADTGDIRLCLLQHKDALSPACEARLQEEPSAVSPDR